MCFSASMSFSASAVLSVFGVVSLAKSQRYEQRVLAGIPLIFAVQQFTEGVLWMSLLHTSWAAWANPATYGFLFFAQVTWPVYIPLCILLLEQKQRKKEIIAALMLAGGILSVYTAFCLYHYPAHAVIGNHHIKYELGFAMAQKWYYGLLYFLPTIVSPLVSSIKKVHLLGYLFLISYVAARLLFHYFEISVWCFFGAMISSIVLFIILYLNKNQYIFYKNNSR
jgi:hypothetical protein